MCSASEVAPGVCERIMAMPPAWAISTCRQCAKAEKTGLVSSGTMTPIPGDEGGAAEAGRS